MSIVNGKKKKTFCGYHKDTASGRGVGAAVSDGCSTCAKAEDIHHDGVDCSHTTQERSRFSCSVGGPGDHVR